jgi:phage shock protein PspC (stress-responsive transcriptional regulator)
VSEPDERPTEPKLEPEPVPQPYPQPEPGPFASRYGLVRPVQGRVLAGVCAAIGRATSTDPILWRVILAVLTLFGGVGLLIYLVAWLMIPAEGDTASAAEALLGRGRSSMSTLTVILVAVLTLMLMVATLSNGPQPALLGVAVIVGGAVLLARSGHFGHRPPAANPPPAEPGVAPTTVTTPMPAPTGYAPPATALEPPTGYRPPFAPHGPYAASSPYAASLGYSTGPLHPYPGLQPAPPVSAPPKPRPPRSKLGRITLSVLLLAMGVLAVLTVTGRSVPGVNFLAVALGVITLALLVGTWIGRARWLIFPGILVSLALIVASTVHGFDPRVPRPPQVWTPLSVAEINPRYQVDSTDATLDLTKVDFANQPTPTVVRVNIDVGHLVVLLPPNVDTEVRANVSVGDANVFDQHWGGVDKTRTVKDEGADGQGGGELRIFATVGLGSLEVHR